MTTAEALSAQAAIIAAKVGLVADHPLRHELDKFATAIDGCARGRSGGPTAFVGTGTGVQSPFLVGTTAVANLPSAVGNNGVEYIVSDSTSATNGATVAGAGSLRVLVRSNNTNWLIV